MNTAVDDQMNVARPYGKPIRPVAWCAAGVNTSRLTPAHF